MPSLSNKREDDELDIYIILNPASLGREQEVNVNFTIARIAHVSGIGHQLDIRQEFTPDYVTIISTVILCLYWVILTQVIDFLEYKGFQYVGIYIFIPSQPELIELVTRADLDSAFIFCNKQTSAKIGLQVGWQGRQRVGC